MLHSGKVTAGLERKMESFLSWVENNLVILAIRRGMVLAMPVLLVAAVLNVFVNLPLKNYQDFIRYYADGSILAAMNLVINATSGFLSLIMLITISYSFAAEVGYKYKIIYAVCAVCSYILFSMKLGMDPDMSMFGAQHMFSAMCIAVISCTVFRFLDNKGQKVFQKLYSEGLERSYRAAMSAIIPIGIVLFIFLVLNLGLSALQGNAAFQEFSLIAAKKIAVYMGSGVGGAVLFVFLMQLLWFFGIHGDNVLLMITYTYFMPAFAMNQTLLSEGMVPNAIFTHVFFNYFVLMGGTGCTICLILAILLASKKANSRRIATMSIFPAIFNINEPILWGYPVILNPYMMIPFLFTPIVILLLSVLAMKLGIVPLTVYNAGWTLPVLFSGVKSTGAAAGGILQLVNIIIGTAIYIPFVKMYEERQIKTLKDSINALRLAVIEGEESEHPVMLMNGNSKLSSVASMLVEDLRHAVKNGEVKLFYQPQIRSDMSVLGAEALLRWKHPVLDDYIYPPLVIELAREDGYLDELGLYIIEEAVKVLSEFSAKTKDSIKISVNISAVQLENPSFCEDVIKIMNNHEVTNGKLAIEITEQISLSASAVITNRINTLRQVGIEFIMDDFGMGHSSMLYLRNNQFSYVKLDGSIVKDLLANERIGDIIDSIKQLSKSLGFDIIAEYVEEEEQRDKLQELGCHIYQGWLYSKAIDIDEFEVFLHKYGALKEEGE